jgi:hypothetical protein
MLRRVPVSAVAALFAYCGLLSCGSSPPPAEAPVETAPPAPEPAAEKPPEPTPGTEDAGATAPPPAEAETVSPADAQRDIRFVQTPEGLRVEILGVKFVPKAEAVKTPAGVGLRLTIEATTQEPRSLLAPAHGPLAFAGSIKRKGKSEPETFGDDRKGEGELLLDPAKPTKITREWPGPKGGGLGNGDVLELDVGLWGLGATAAERRPVKQFLRVKVVVEQWKGRAKIEPPPSMKGK